MLAVGVSKRVQYLEWKREHSWVTGFGFESGKGYGALTWQSAF